MSELGAILTALVNGQIHTMYQLPAGARLYWSRLRRELLIARPNARPPADEMAVFRRHIKAAGYAILAERDGEPIEESLNTYLGYALRLEPASTPEPQAEQMRLIE